MFETKHSNSASARDLALSVVILLLVLCSSSQDASSSEMCQERPGEQQCSKTKTPFQGPPLLCDRQVGDFEADTPKVVCLESTTGSPLGDPLTSLASPPPPGHSRELLRIWPPWPRPAQFSLAADSDRIAFVVGREKKYGPFVLLAYEVDTPSFREVGRVALTNGLKPTALLGFADGRVLVGFQAARVDYVDLQEGTEEVLHDLTGISGKGKAIDAFAWNGANLLVAVDDFVTPKWMLSFDLSVERRPNVMGRVSLPNGVNDHILDARFLDTQSLVLLDEFEHMAGRGSSLSFMSLDASGLNFTKGHAHEFMEWEADEGTTWVGNFSRMLKLEKVLNDELVIAASERGLVIIPNETQRECFNIKDNFQQDKKLRSGAKLVRTPFPARNLCCRQNLTVVLQLQEPEEEQEEQPTSKQFHVSIYNRQWEELNTFAWPYLWSDEQK